jgi:hypothetical protein
VHRRTPTNDYAVYSAVLRAYFVAPAADPHPDGADETCEVAGPVDHLSIVRETRLRREGGGSRDSALAAELPPRTAPMMATLRTVSGEPARVLDPDSFTVPVPVVLTDSTQSKPKGERPITLSRVAYNADSTDALVLAVQPCTATRKHKRKAGGDGSAPGQSVLVGLHRQRGAWVVQKHVELDVE